MTRPHDESNPERATAGAEADGPSDSPECVACGACCFFDDPRYVLVFEDDYERLGKQAAELTHWVAGRSFMRLHEGHCAALEVEPEGRYVCSVYADRPRLCREFARDSAACRREQTLKRSRAQAALVQVRIEQRAARAL